MAQKFKSKRFIKVEFLCKTVLELWNTFLFQMKNGWDLTLSNFLNQISDLTVAPLIHQASWRSQEPTIYDFWNKHHDFCYYWDFRCQTTQTIVGFEEIAITYTDRRSSGKNVSIGACKVVRKVAWIEKFTLRFWFPDL